MDKTEKKYTVLLSKNEERIQIPKELNCKAPLLLTNILLQVFHPLLRIDRDDVDITKMLRAINLLGTVLDTNIDISDMVEGYEETNYFLLFREIQAIKYAMDEWVEHNDYSLKEGFKNAAFYLQKRLEQSPPVPKLFSGYKARVHKTNSLLCLAWAEIWFAIEIEIPNVKTCSFCGTVYFAPKNNPDKSHCGSPECKKQYLIKSHGGIEGYREWERNRKKVFSKHGKGRPKKQKEGE